jgi:hypothetical protein
VEILDEKEWFGENTDKSRKDEIYEFLFDEYKTDNQPSVKADPSKSYILCRVVDCADDVFLATRGSIVSIPYHTIERFDLDEENQVFITKDNFIVATWVKNG